MEAIRRIVEKIDNTLTLSIPESITSTKFEVIVLPIDDEGVREEWMQYIYQNKSFEFLNDIEEEIYTINDGKPYEHKK